MTDEKSMRSGLLAANGIAQNAISDADRAAMKAILKRHTRRAKRLKWVVITAWSLLVALLVCASVCKSAGLDSPEGNIGLIFFFPIYAAYYVAIALTIIYVARRVILAYRQISVRALEVEARLTAIEAVLRTPDNKG